MIKPIIRDLTPPLIWRALHMLIHGPQVKPEVIEIPINQCVHYSGFRYGTSEYNPYQDYMVDLKKHVSIEIARQRFIEYLKYYRPYHMGEALGLNTLSKEYPLWKYPWQPFKPEQANALSGWFTRPEECLDVQSNFCELGILSSYIEHEFCWLEWILKSVEAYGYQPERYGCYIRVQQFYRSDGAKSYLVVDGNHRVSAMHTLGHKYIKVEYFPSKTVYETACDEWFGVKSGFYRCEDALQIFHAYFKGNTNYRTTTTAAKIIVSDNGRRLNH